MIQTWGSTPSEMYDNGMTLSKIDRERIVIKVPVTTKETEVARRLMESGVRVCLTAGYDSKQALIAASLGVEYLAPYLGRCVRCCFDCWLKSTLLLRTYICSCIFECYFYSRMTDNGKDGFVECRRMQKIVDGLGSDTRILVASLRDAETLGDLAVDGLDTFTFSPAVARMLFEEPLTDIAAAEFEEAAARGGKE